MGFLTILAIAIGAFLIQANAFNQSFYAYYSYLWGTDHFYVDPQGTEVTLKMDRSSGAGFRSKVEYGSGLFHMRMKIPQGRTGGIVTSFYLIDVPDGQEPGNHFEIDYEFLGTNGIVQTNVYDNDMGHREQSFQLWFNPSQDFHSYDFLWNSNHIVFLIDNIPVRVFNNNEGQGVPFPNRPMHIECSIWDADWAGQVDWTDAPFIAHYSDFGFDGCWAQANNISACNDDRLWWNKPEYRYLTDAQKGQMAYYRKKYMVYDYCWKPSTAMKECSLNN